MELIEINKNLTASLEENEIKQSCDEKSNPSMSYNYFFSQYLLINRPCVFQADITNAWPCAQQWKLKNAPNFKRLKQLYGDDLN